MKKLLSYIGMAAILGAALIVAGCTRSDSETKTAAGQPKAQEPPSSDEADQGELVPEMGEKTEPASSGDDGYQSEPVPEFSEDQIMALYGMPPSRIEHEEAPAENEDEDDEIKELEKIPGEPPVRALYGVNAIR